MLVLPKRMTWVMIPLSEQPSVLRRGTPLISALDAADTPLAETFRIAQHAMSSPRTVELAATLRAAG
jgi:hypothetical protein